MNALALVIGNSQYNTEKDKLPNASNDAVDFGEKLLSMGFTVMASTDCDLEMFDRQVISFGDQLNDYEVGLFYFSGHGLQIDGKNYLTAIDTTFTDDLSAKHSSIPLDFIIEKIQRAKPSIKILILDACRDNPLPNLYRGIHLNGLAPIHAPKGTIVAFSTSPGEKAMDYGLGRNSIYTGSLLNHINDENVSIEDFFKRVRTTVFTLSNGKQTSWEHTSLIGNFYFNSGQLVHSVGLPYKQEYIADENFQSDGTAIGSIIEDLKSQNYYTQKPALERLQSIDPTTIDANLKFLLGRNILQTATGGEGFAIKIFKNLKNWLVKYSEKDGKNHILNGILFEVYFNSKGRFREHSFKNELIEEIFKLQTDVSFSESFQFILKQLSPFSNYLFYLPVSRPVPLPIEVKFEKYEYKMPNWENEKNGYKLISVKHEEVELLSPNNDDYASSISISFEEFKDKLCKQLCVPKHMLRLSMNTNEEDLKRISIPYNFQLNRNHKD